MYDFLIPKEWWEEVKFNLRKAVPGIFITMLISVAVFLNSENVDMVLLLFEMSWFLFGFEHISKRRLLLSVKSLYWEMF